MIIRPSDKEFCSIQRMPSNSLLGQSMRCNTNIEMNTPNAKQCFVDKIDVGFKWHWRNDIKQPRFK